MTPTEEHPLFIEAAKRLRETDYPRDPSEYTFAEIMDTAWLMLCEERDQVQLLEAAFYRAAGVA